VDDIASMVDGDCGITTTPNFPLVDFVIKRAMLPVNILGNFTVAKKHAGSIDTLPDIIAKLGGGPCCSLIVTPQDKMSAYKHNSKLILNDTLLPQFVTANIRVATMEALATMYKKPPEVSALAKGKRKRVT